MKRLALLTAALLVAGCASRGAPKIEAREVPVPVAVKCAVDPGPEPQYADTDAALRAAPDIFEKTKLLLAGRAQRMAYIIEVKAANAGCR